MKTEIVIARYDEKLDWVKKIEKNIKITIYNKGKNDIDFPFITLPNIGRESHTYLYHIINNYDKLADQTIFCQGDSIFHSPDFLNLIKNRKYFEPIQPLSAFYSSSYIWTPEYSYPYPLLLSLTKNLHINNNRVHVEYMDNNLQPCYPLYNHINIFPPTFSDIMKKIYKIDNIMEFNIKRFRLKNIDLNKLIPFCYSALFSVNKNVILENSIDFYNNIISILIYDIRTNNECGRYCQNGYLDHGLMLEQLWLVIFNYKKNNKNYLDLDVKDYLISESNLIIKNNNIKFKFLYLNKLYIVFYIDKIKYIITDGVH